MYIYIHPHTHPHTLTSDEEASGGKLLEENDTLATEAASEEDEHAAGDKVGLELGGLLYMAGAAAGHGHIVSRVDTGSLAGRGRSRCLLGATLAEELIAGTLLHRLCEWLGGR